MQKRRTIITRLAMSFDKDKGKDEYDNEKDKVHEENSDDHEERDGKGE